MSSARAPLTIGGAGALPGLEDVARVAQGLMPVLLDAAAAERVKRESPAPKALQLEAGPPPPSTASGGPCLAATQTRAVLVTRLLSVMAGKSGVRLQVAEYLGELLNRGISPVLDTAGSEADLLRQVADTCHGAGLATSFTAGAANDAPAAPLSELLSSSGLTAPGLSATERAVLQSGAPATAGLAALTVQAGRTLHTLATATAALSCEALGLQVGAFEVDLLEAQGYKSAIATGDDLRSLLEGSKRINTLRGGGDTLGNFYALPQSLGGLAESLTAANAGVRPEVQAAVVPLKGPTSPAVRSSTLPSVIVELSRSFNALATASLRRAMRVAEGRPDLLAIGASLEAAVSASRKATVTVGMQLLEDPDAAPGVQAALAADQAVSAAQQVVAFEALTAVAVLRILEGPVQPAAAAAPAASPSAPAADAPAAEAAAGEKGKGKEGSKGKDGDKKKDRKAGGASGLTLGKGTALLRTYIEMAAVSATASAPSIAGQMAQLALADVEGAAPAAVAWDRALLGVAGALAPGTDKCVKFLAELRDVVEANQARRKPKVAKGARDMLPDQMAVREAALATITGVFKRHGAVSIDTPVFELRETLTGKYGEDSKLIYDIADQGGELLSLRYDLTVPFARFVAVHNMTNIKRFHIGKVYRRDQPQMAKGRFREFYQCDFDVAGVYSSMVPDAEVLAVTVEILTALQLGPFTVKLSHRRLLDAMLQIAGVPPQKFLTICSAIDKLDKEPWSAVRAEMVDEKGLPEDVADKIGEMVVLKGEPMAMLAKLNEEGSVLAAHPESRAALDELGTLFGYLQAMGALGPIVLDLSLARGLHYYTGVIYEAVLTNGGGGSIAAGGRYDRLVGMFSGKDVPAVGISIGIERIFAITENVMKEAAIAAGRPLRTTETQVLVASIGNGMQTKRMELCAKLWAAGIKAEFGYKTNPKMGDQLNYMFEADIPFMVLFGESEVAEGVVKIKDFADKTEVAVPEGTLVAELKQRLAALA